MEYQDFYYRGFEGEPEIQIISQKAGYKEVFAIWEGYFDQIMQAIEPDTNGWCGVAYYYNMNLGWYEESPWEVQDLCGTLAQLKAIKQSRLPAETTEILEILCSKLAEAIKNGFRIFIVKE